MAEQEPLIPLTLGERLRADREKRGLSRADVVQRLHCREDFVVSLEEGLPSTLAPVYQRGFARKYAQMLGWDAAAVERLLEQFEQGETELRPVFRKPPPPRAAERWLRASTYVLASLLVGTLAWQITHEAVRLSQSDQDEATADVTAPQQAPAGGQAHVNASIASLESLGRYGQQRPTAGGAQAWAAMDRPRQASAETTLLPGEHLLALTTSADSWVEIRDRDGKVLEHDLVRGGSNRAYRGIGPYRITLGRTSAVQLSLDGEPVTLSPGSRDDVTQMTLDPEALPPPATPAGG